MEKMAQLRPEGSRHGIEVSRWSESAVNNTEVMGAAELIAAALGVEAMVYGRVVQENSESSRLFRAAGAHNL